MYTPMAMTQNNACVFVIWYGNHFIKTENTSWKECYKINGHHKCWIQQHTDKLARQGYL